MEFSSRSRSQSSDSEIDTNVDVNERMSLVPIPTTGFGRRKPQFIAAFVVTIGAIGLGNVLGWSSPALPDLEKNKQLGELSVEMKSWIGSIVNLGTLASALATGFTMDRIGRRMTLLVFSIPFCLSWILIACSQNFAMMLIGRFITGLCGGIWIAVVPVYMSEIAEDKIRGMLSSIMVVGLATGILFSYVIGSFINWIWLSMICSSVPLIFLVCMIFLGIPESPRYLLAKGYRDKACESLKWFRGESHVTQVEPELMRIEGSIRDARAEFTTWRDYLSRPILKPTIICLILMFFQQFGGINAVLFYSMDIFKIAGLGIDPALATIIIGLTQLLMVGLSTFLVDRAGRKILLIISGVGMSISLITLAIFFQLKAGNGGEPPKDLGWLPILSMVSFIISYNIGIASIPWIMIGELIPQQAKAFSCPLVTAANSTLGFIITKYFEVFTELIGISAVFYIFATISAVGVVFAALIVPETKGKSLEEIQALFRKV